MQVVTYNRTFGQVIRNVVRDTVTLLRVALVVLAAVFGVHFYYQYTDVVKEVTTLRAENTALKVDVNELAKQLNITSNALVTTQLQSKEEVENLKTKIEQLKAEQAKTVEAQQNWFVRKYHQLQGQ